MRKQWIKWCCNISIVITLFSQYPCKIGGILKVYLFTKFIFHLFCIRVCRTCTCVKQSHVNINSWQQSSQSGGGVCVWSRLTHPCDNRRSVVKIHVKWKLNSAENYIDGWLSWPWELILVFVNLFWPHHEIWWTSYIKRLIKPPQFWSNFKGTKKHYPLQCHWWMLETDSISVFSLRILKRTSNTAFLMASIILAWNGGLYYYMSECS